MQNLSYESEFYSKVHFYANQTHFHLNGFTSGLILKQRQKATRKWPNSNLHNNVLDMSSQSLWSNDSV